MADEFDDRAAQRALGLALEERKQATRNYEDAKEIDDDISAGYAADALVAAQAKIDRLTGTPQSQQQSGELSYAQKNFLSRRAALGDELSPARMQDYQRAHIRAVAAGWTPDTPEYFSAIEKCVDGQGDGREPVLDERGAARICESKYGSVSDAEYSQNAAKLQWLRQRGLHD
jgi:hypothetical protein